VKQIKTEKKCLTRISREGVGTGHRGSVVHVVVLALRHSSSLSACHPGPVGSSLTVFVGISAGSCVVPGASSAVMVPVIPIPWPCHCLSMYHKVEHSPYPPREQLLAAGAVLVLGGCLAVRRGGRSAVGCTSPVPLPLWSLLPVVA
jgi:hypothetical protein